MDDETKAQMLARIDAIEARGLPYNQNGEEHRSSHFDLTPLKKAYQCYLNGFDDWLGAKNADAKAAAWLEIGVAQRDVPAHIAQEYCHPKRDFDPLPSFNVDGEDILKDSLPRKLMFYNFASASEDTWYPLKTSNSRLGIDFVITRHGAWRGCAGGLRGRVSPHPIKLLIDLEAINHLDEVRTADLKRSQEHLNQLAMFKNMNV